MNRDYYALWLKFRQSKESLSQFAKRVGVPKSELSVAFRALSQADLKIALLERRIYRLEENLRRCYEELNNSKGLGSFLKRLIGG